MGRTASEYHTFETAGGFCGIAWSGAGITRFQLPAGSADEAERLLLHGVFDAVPGDPPAAVGQAVAAAKRYFAGTKVDFSEFRLDLSGQTDLFSQIYDAVRRVGWGQTTTYGTLAKDLGRGAQAARSVGQAMATNPIPLIIPCHRVLAAGGKLGGFSAPGGIASKTRMLELEGVYVGPKQQSLGF